MRVVDTSAWIEWSTGTALGLAVSAEIPFWEVWLVPTAVQYELVRWARRTAGPEAGEGIVMQSSQGIVAPLTTELAHSAAQIAEAHGLAMADAIIYATALANDADLLTCDAHFQGLPNVVYFKKGAP